MILDVVCPYLSLFLLYINIEIGENRCKMLDLYSEIAVHLAVACDVLMTSFCAVLFSQETSGMRSGT